MNKEEGVDFEFVKTDRDGLRDEPGLGRFDANYTLVMYLFEANRARARRQIDRRYTHRLLAGPSRLELADQDRGQPFEARRSPSPPWAAPFLFTSRVLAAHEMNPMKNVSCIVVAPDAMGLAPGQRPGRRDRHERAGRLDSGRSGEGSRHRRGRADPGVDSGRNAIRCGPRGPVAPVPIASPSAVLVAILIHWTLPNKQTNLPT